MAKPLRTTKSEARSLKSEVRAPKSDVRTQKSDAKGQRSTLELDRLVHERLRLGIVSALAVNDSLTFNDLKRLLSTTDGNLSVHARKLEDAEYIICTKSFDGRLPRTEYRLTPSGRRALEKYIAHMESIIRTVKD